MQIYELKTPKTGKMYFIFINNTGETKFLIRFVNHIFAFFSDIFILQTLFTSH